MWPNALTAQYETRLFKRMMTLQNMSGQTGDVFLHYVLKYSPAGVALRVDKVICEGFGENISILCILIRNRVCCSPFFNCCLKLLGVCGLN